MTKKALGLRHLISLLVAEQARIRAQYPQTPEEMRVSTESWWTALITGEQSQLPARKMAAYPIWWYSKIFQPIASVVSAQALVQDHQVYVRRFPWSGTTVSRGGYLEFVVTSYLQSVYVLLKRTERCLGTIKNEYKRDLRAATIRARTSDTISTLNTAFAAPIELRGKHVHEYGLQDPSIQRIQSLELLSKHGSSTSWGQHLNDLCNTEFRKLRGQYRTAVRSHIQSIDLAVDFAAILLIWVLFDEREKFLEPPGSDSA